MHGSPEQKKADAPERQRTTRDRPRRPDRRRLGHQAQDYHGREAVIAMLKPNLVPDHFYVYREPDGPDGPTGPAGP